MNGARSVERASSQVRGAALPAAVALAAIIATFISMTALCRMFDGGDNQPAIVAAFIAVALARRPRRSTQRHIGIEAALIVSIAPLAAGVGWLLHAKPVVGAVVFTALLALSVYGRKFGARIRTASSWIALPLVAILVVPPPHATGGFAELALSVAAGLVALVCVRASETLARAAGVRPTPTLEADAVGPRAATAAARSGWSPATRMALQMAVAVGAAFVVGIIAFPAHRGWSVLTAFIVCGGARGRGDALYTGVLRLLGALGGTIVAAALAPLGVSGGPLEALAIFAILYVGLTLRDLSYAYWAACMTLILALLAPVTSESTRVMLELRLAAILAGAICAVAAAWFVTPIRTEAVVRRRLADALLALDELLADPHPDEATVRHARFEYRMTELDGVAPPVEWHRRLFVVAPDAEHPANWIASARKLRAHARAVIAAGVDQPGPIRRAIGLCRRAIANHGKPSAPPNGPSLGRSLAAIDAAFAQATAAKNLGSD